MDDLFDDIRGERHTFEFDKCDKSELTNIIKDLKSNAAGTDGLNLKAVKSLMNYIMPCNVFLINLSFETGKFPSELKQSKVLPLHKGGCKKDRTNYRPISLLPILSKLYEKVAHKHLYSYLEGLGMLSESRFGFRREASTSDVLHHLMDLINDALKKGLIHMTISVDLRK